MTSDSHVITTYAWFRPTGAARRLRRAVTALAATGVKVDYIAVKPPEFESPNVTVHAIKIPRLFASADPSKRSPGIVTGKQIGRASCRERVYVLV